MIGAILGGISAASSLFGSLKSAQANKRMDNQLQRRQSELQSWYDKEYNTNYLDTAEAKGTLRVLSNNMKESMQKVDQGNAIQGASDEARVATADKAQRRYGDTVARIAGHGTQYKDAIRREYAGRKMNLDALQAQNLQQKSANWSNFANNALSAGVGFAEAGGSGSFDKWDGKLGSLFRKQPSAGVKASYEARYGKF